MSQGCTDLSACMGYSLSDMILFVNHLHLDSIDLFAGAGLLSYAFREFGCRTELAVEADARAAGSFAKNVGAESFATDVRRVTQGINCRILLAGPPCQGFSSLGKRDASDERNDP